MTIAVCMHSVKHPTLTHSFGLPYVRKAVILCSLVVLLEGDRRMINTSMVYLTGATMGDDTHSPTDESRTICVRP